MTIACGWRKVARYGTSLCEGPANDEIFALGIGIIRFLSKALERSFKPFQRVAVEIMMLECELLVEEYSHGKLNDTSLEKDAQQWLENVETVRTHFFR